jgi:tRNA (guanine37-N1)-methyltransferase
VSEPKIRIDIISALPETFDSVLGASIVGRARSSGAAVVEVHNLREYGLGTYRQIDDTPFGGGAGMILKPEPLFEVVERLRSERDYDHVLFPTPDGERYTQRTANRLSLARNLILICGHYRGIDQRVRDALVTQEISIGDYVLTGGELPAMIIVDSIVRLLPGVLGDAESALSDSFQADMLDAPWYTKPAEFRGLKVPDVLVSGDHGKIADWREEQALRKTRERRPDLLDDGQDANFEE